MVFAESGSMPNVTKSVSSAANKAYSKAFSNSLLSSILWSEGRINNNDLCLLDFLRYWVAAAIAGAVFLPTGSRIIAFGFILILLFAVRMGK